MKILALSVIVLTLSACGLESETTSDAQLDFLTGSWSTVEDNCTDLNDEFTLFGYTKLTFEDGKMINTGFKYSDEDCTTPMYTIAGYSDLEFVGNEYLASGDLVSKIIINTHTHQLTSHNSDYTAQLNSNSYCDRTDWTTDIANDTTTCVGETTTKLIFLVEGDIMLTGDDDYMAEDGFQTALSRDNPLFKL